MVARGSLLDVFDVVAVTAEVTPNPALAAGITPTPESTINTNLLVHHRKEMGAVRFVTMDADEVTPEVVLATEGSPA